jgi:hypothetical protein
MKKGLCISIIAIALAAGRIFPSERRDDSYLIRRAYLDTLGIVPTLTEIEWYCVYNDNGYELAARWLVTKTKMLQEGRGELLNILVSDEYKKAKKTHISRSKVHEIVMYVAGEDGEANPSNVKKAKYRLIANAMLCETGDLDIIDLMANQLMCRGTTVNEANELLKCLRLSRTAMPEEEAWLNTLEHLLLFEDVASK